MTVTGYTKAGADAQFATAAQLATKADSSALATVATSGSYTDLTNQPTIPAAQVQTDWNAATGMGAILNKPTLGTASAQDVTAFATAAQGSKADTAVQPATLAGYVPTTRLVNGKALSSDVTLSAADVGALTQTAADARYATSAQGAEADAAVPNTRTVNGKALSADITLSAADVSATPAGLFNFTSPVDGDVAQYDSTSGLFVNSPLDFGSIAGTAALAQMTPGATFRVLWDTTVNAGAGGWTYPAGTYITTRPTARTDIFMDAVDYTGGSTQPAFAITGDSYEVKSP